MVMDCSPCTPSSVLLEVLRFPLVALGGVERIEGAEIAPAPGLSLYLDGVQPVGRTRAF
jgi:hypothetical protein